MGNQCNGYYIFQGNNLLIPADMPDSRIHEVIGAEIKNELLKKIPDSQTDEFSISALEGPRPISALMIRSSEVPEGWKQIQVRQVLGVMTAGAMAEGTGDTGRLLRAFHIAQWRRESVFCGTCGARNGDAENEVARRCPACGRLEFPRISPAVITIIVNDRDEILLAHNIKFTSKMYSLIAGFNEASESLEATVEREIREEVCIEVRDIRYVCSQPWPFPNSLMLGFTARHAGGGIKCDGVEIEDAQWFSRGNLPALPSGGSVSRHLINLWYEGKLF